MASDTEVVVVEGGLPSKYVWQMELVAGLITLGLGIVLALRPSQSLNVICVFIGILLIIGSIFMILAVGVLVERIVFAPLRRRTLINRGLLR